MTRTLRKLADRILEKIANDEYQYTGVDAVESAVDAEMQKGSVTDEEADELRTALLAEVDA